MTEPAQFKVGDRVRLLSPRSRGSPFDFRRLQQIQPPTPDDQNTVRREAKGSDPALFEHLLADRFGENR